MKKALFRLWQWTWGFPQSLLGFVIRCMHKEQPSFEYHGCIVTRWKSRGSMGVGMYLFLSESSFENKGDVLVHEFGHSVQSIFLGPLFLPIMGLPSMIWCNLPPFRKLRKEKGVSYYSFYPESSANYLGRLVTKEPCNLK